ncbi:RasGEF domain [Carpediemonas membranifera]|uniref:RasGEF domain n=1 Tax=Carpediemonas membranifera TaxID=201153 RepID=A0A8J6E0T8_9EUKA|nr:RasGEF domain [Carpediemonas membranifera]|eukprot:KAG9392633.1 RasGEF domain [Carpediemonas membranifera]
MKLYVTISNTTPFLLQADENLTIQQYKDYILQAYDALYEHNTKLKFIRVVRLKEDEGEGAMLFQFERHDVADGGRNVTEREHLSLHVYAEGPERPDGERPNVVYVKAADMQPRIQKGQEFETIMTFTDGALLSQGSVNRIALYLTEPNHNLHTRNVFMLVMRQYLRPDQLFTRMLQRFHMRTPRCKSQLELNSWLVNTRIPVQKGVCQLLFDWITCYPEDVVPIIEPVKSFVTETLDHPSLSKARTDLIQLIATYYGTGRPYPFLELVMARGKQQFCRLFSNRMIPSSVTSQLRTRPERPTKIAEACNVFLKSWGTTPWADFYTWLTNPATIKKNGPVTDAGHERFSGQLFAQSPDAIAETINSIMFEAYSNVQPRELVGKLWTFPQTYDRCPNLRALTVACETVGNWTSVTVMSRGDKRIRGWVYCNLVATACKLYLTGNFAGLFAILNALNATPVRRLQVIEGLKPKHYGNSFTPLKAALELLNPIAKAEEDNYGAYRAELNTRSVTEATIPFPGMVMKDCFWTEDGIPRIVNGMVNLTRGYRLYNSIATFLCYQAGQGYPLQANDHTEMLGRWKVVAQDELFEMSYRVKPRISE